MSARSAWAHHNTVGFAAAAERLCCRPDLRPRAWAHTRDDGGFVVLNRFERTPPMAGEAEVRYLDGDFRVIRPGAFVRCAVTGVAIPLEELKYWSVDLQEAYSTPEVVLQRHFRERMR
jgi:hypothetical protein